MYKIENNLLLLIVLVVHSQKVERIEKFMQTRNVDFIYKNDLDKACFQHDMVYGKSNDSAKRTQSDKNLRKFKIASNPKYDGCQRRLASMVYKFLIKNHINAVLLPNQIISLHMNFTNKLLENLRK